MLVRVEDLFEEIGLAFGTLNEYTYRGCYNKLQEKKKRPQLKQ